MRSSVEGCVENKLRNIRPLNGLMMNRCAVAGEASIGICFEYVSSFCKAEIKLYGVPVYLADASSASYSRVREIAIWIIIAAMGARIIMRMPPQPPPPSSFSSRRPPPNQYAMRAADVEGAQIASPTDRV